MSVRQDYGGKVYNERKPQHTQRKCINGGFLWCYSLLYSLRRKREIVRVNIFVLLIDARDIDRSYGALPFIRVFVCLLPEVVVTIEESVFV